MQLWVRKEKPNRPGPQLLFASFVLLFVVSNPIDTLKASSGVCPGIKHVEPCKQCFLNKRKLFVWRFLAL